jgi:hypothetical protein
MEKIKDSNPLPLYITGHSAMATKKRCSFEEVVTVIGLRQLISPKAGRMG